MFTLDLALKENNFFIRDLPLSRLLLANNRLYPWVILVPRRPDIVELIDLNPQDQRVLWQEISTLSKVLQDLFSPDKLNVASLGNVVRQLHVHIVARSTQDATWPDPIWGAGKPHEPYSEEEKNQRVTILQSGLSPFF